MVRNFQINNGEILVHCDYERHLHPVLLNNGEMTKKKEKEGENVLSRV